VANKKQKMQLIIINKMTTEQTKKISKFLSLVLRHQPQTINLKLDTNGWANTQELIEKCGKKGVKFSLRELEIVVETNDKKRFIFNEDKTKIRANQGHSVEIDLALKPIEPPDFLYHGTSDKTVNLILEEGIKKMSRQHVHLSQDKETAIKVGSRHGKPIVLTIMASQMHQDGILFYQSENGVWLTDFIDKKYISK
jgi:putative RNA 2'-phosphotransferase